MTTEMSITQALAELKLLRKRLESALGRRSLRYDGHKEIDGGPRSF